MLQPSHGSGYFAAATQAADPVPVETGGPAELEVYGFVMYLLSIIGFGTSTSMFFAFFVQFKAFFVC